MFYINIKKKQKNPQINQSTWQYMMQYFHLKYMEVFY